MKAAVLHEYGPASNLKYEDFADPTPGPGQVLIKVSAVSINPVDWKMRSGEAKERFPVEFPGILGRDVAGIVREVGEGVTTFAPGDHVMALSHATYAELCVVDAKDLARVPDGMDMTTASTLPLVNLTGELLIREGAAVKAGDTVLITGALGGVGRSAVLAAVELGAKVIAGVHAKQIDEAKELHGVIDAIAIDDDAALARLGMMDSVADTVGGKLAPKLLAKIKESGSYGSVLGPPTDAALHPTVRIGAIMAQPKPEVTVHFAEAVRDGKLQIPVDRVMPLSEAAEAQAIAEAGAHGKIVLVP